MTSVPPLSPANHSSPAAPRNLPPRIRTDASNAFAQNTMAVRVPAILDEVLANNPDYAPGVRTRIVALRDALRAGERLPPIDASAPHAALWVPELARRDGHGWQSSDWFCVENYAYRCLADAAEFWRDARDPFAPTKHAEYASAAHRDALEAAVAIEGPSVPPGERLERLLLADVFANRMDLSFAASRDRGIRSESSDLLVDDRARAIEQLRGGNGAVHFIIDNAGTELTLDLVLAAHLIEQLSAPVVLHVKVHPAFVSDAIERDVRWFVQGGDARAEALWGPSTAAAQSRRATLAAALDDGRLRIAPHPYWNGPASLWELPEPLVRELSGARLVLLKGDAHYRRAVGDALWPPEASFAAVTAYFPAPLLALRTLKSDTIVGLPAGMAARLDRDDARWRVNGQRAVASLGGTLR
ncbi:MAG TPA: damage-control phosphatase ARMT1 family protein [Polyangiaceae bacterium]|nr:damage-control phosphatase ARMT1 family protein [Polyangiaceae bacterium]